MVWAADAAGNPDPGELAASDCLFIARYLGTPYQRYGVTREYVDACHAHGVGVGLIAEEWASQFLGGYDTARAACDRAMAAWDALGAPRDGSVIPMVVLVDPSPGAVLGNEQLLLDFARGWDDALTEAGFPEWTGYGSRYGLDLAGEVAPHMTRRWGVGTWGFGERPDGSLPEHVPADMIQHGNRAAPVAGCDYNTLFRLDMGQWGGSHKEEDHMRMLAVQVPGDERVWLWWGCYKTHVPTPEVLGAMAFIGMIPTRPDGNPVHEISASLRDALVTIPWDASPVGSPPAASVDAGAIAKAVREEFRQQPLR